VGPDVFPYRLHTVLTDNGVQFCHPPRYREPTARFAGHLFDRICAEHGIEHRLTKPNHPWTNGQVERMNRIIKDATVKRSRLLLIDIVLRRALHKHSSLATSA